MTKEALYAHPGWEWCTFAGARKHTLLMGMRATLREKLEWLEEAEKTAMLFGSPLRNKDLPHPFDLDGETTHEKGISRQGRR